MLTDAQLALRREGLTATDMVILAGCSRFATPLDVYESASWMRRGNRSRRWRRNTPNGADKKQRLQSKKKGNDMSKKKRSPSRALSPAQVRTAVAKFAKQHKLSVADAQTRLVTIAVNRMAALDRYRAQEAKPKRKTAKPVAAKKAAKKTSKPKVAPKAKAKKASPTPKAATE